MLKGEGVAILGHLLGAATGTAVEPASATSSAPPLTVRRLARVDPADTALLAEAASLVPELSTGPKLNPVSMTGVVGCVSLSSSS